MATGIRVTGKNNKINDNNVKSDEIGIDVLGDSNDVLRNIVEVTDRQIRGISEQLNLPVNLPAEHLLEAIRILKSSNDIVNAPQHLESSNLRSWLEYNGFNMAFWASTAISLAGISLSL
jgi:hypothetical protein